MVPQRLILKGFMSYREEQELSFMGSSLLVLAGPNGAGKSTIFDAITYALYGKTRAERGDNAHLINHDSDRLLVRFDFLLDGVEYRVERTLNRTYSRGGQERAPRATRQVLRRGDGGEMEPVPDTTREEDYRRWLGGTLGIDYEAFTTAVLLQQGRAETLISAEPAGRREILKQLLGLSRFERVHEVADGERLRLERLRDDLERELRQRPEVPQEALASAEAAARAAEAAAGRWEREVHELSALRVHARHFTAWSQRHSELAARLTAAREILGRREEILDGYGRWLELGQVIQVLERMAEQEARLRRLRARIEQLAQEIRELAAQQDEAHAAALALEAQEAAGSAALDALREQARVLAEEMLEIQGPAERWGQMQKARRRREAALSRLRATGAEGDVVEGAERVRALEEGQAALPWLLRIRKHRDQLALELEKERERAGALSGLEAEVAGLGARLSAVEGALEQARSRERALADARSAAAEGLRQEEERLRRFTLAAQGAACELCGQEISQEHAVREQDRLRRAVGAGQGRHKEASEALQAGEARRRELEDEARVLRQGLTERQRARDLMESALRQGQRAAEQLRRELDEAVARLPVRYRSGEQRDEEVEQLQAELAALPVWRELAQEERELARLLEQAPAHELERAALRLQGLVERRAEIDGERQAREAGLRQLKQRAGEARRGIQAIEKERGERERSLTGLRAEHAKCEGERQATVAQAPEAWRERVPGLGGEEAQALREELRSLARYEGLHGALQEAERGDLEEQVRGLSQQLAEVPERARRPEMEVAREQEGAEKALRAAKEDLAGKREAWRRLVEAAQRQREKQAERDQVAEEHVLHERLARALGPRGLQRWLIQQAEQGIVAQANQTLHDLTGGRLWLKLESDEESKKALDLLVCNRETSERPMPIAMCSGSQRFRIAISLALATGRYLSREARRVESVIIDEGFGCLDRESRADTVEVLKSLRGKLARIILVSHQDEFTSSFTQGYRIELQDRSSRVIALSAGTA
jgi:exonuclease SbcC